MTQFAFQPNVTLAAGVAETINVEATPEQVVEASVAKITNAYQLPSDGVSALRSGLNELKKLTRDAAPEVASEIITNSLWLVDKIAAELGNKAPTAVPGTTDQIEFDALLRDLAVVTEKAAADRRQGQALSNLVAKALTDRMPSDLGRFDIALGRASATGPALVGAVVRQLDGNSDPRVNAIRARLTSMPACALGDEVRADAGRMLSIASELTRRAQTAPTPGRVADILNDGQAQIGELIEFLGRRAIPSACPAGAASVQDGAPAQSATDDRIVFDAIVAQLAALVERASADPGPGNQAAQAIALNIAYTIVQDLPDHSVGRFGDAFAQAAHSGHGRTLASAVAALLEREEHAAQADAISRLLASVQLLRHDN